MSAEKIKPLSVILFGPLFSAAEVLFNKSLKGSIEALSQGLLSVTLPQDEVKQFIDGQGIVNFEALYQHNLTNAIGHQLAVAVLDGSDHDSGTCIEVGARWGNNPVDITIGLRTDFRASEDGHINAMLRVCDSLVYTPITGIQGTDEIAEQVIRHLFGQIILIYGFENSKVCNYNEAVEWYHKFRPHIPTK